MAPGARAGRVGELLGEFKSPDARTDQPRPGGEARSQTEAAEDAGISKRHRENALSVAKVPDDQFEAAVEARASRRTGARGRASSRAMLVSPRDLMSQSFAR